MKEGWKYMKLGEVCDILNGFAFKSSNYVDCGIRIIRITNVQKGIIVDNSPKYYPLSEESNLNKYILKKNDLLMSLTGNVGRVGLLPKGLTPAALNQRVACIRMKNDNLSKTFLFHYLNSNSFEQLCIENASGAAQLNLSTVWLFNVQIPVPPISDQQRIVSYLDAEFAKIEALKANAEKQLQAAKDLFQAALKELLTPKEGWVEKKLGEVCSKIGSGATPKGGKKVYLNNGCSLIRSLNVLYGSFKYSELAHITEDAAEQLKGVTIKENDVLLNITGASIARCCVVPTDVLPARVNQHVSILRVDTDRINPLFLSFLLLNPKHQKELLTIGEAGTTRQALTKADLENHIIEFPNIEKQSQIIKRISELSAEVKSLQTNYTETITLCNDLKQALLKKVFG